MKQKLYTLKRAIQRRDLIDKIFCTILMQLGYSSYKMQALEIRNKRFSRIKRKYSKILTNINYEEDTLNAVRNNNVWVCWFQGIENAPAIVKKCIRSIECYMPEADIHIITAANMDKFVELPKFIKEKWQQGVITNTHLSDMLRVELLVRYGGIWMDATTFLTGPIPEYIYDHDIFLYKWSDVNDYIQYNSWFIYAQPNTRILKATRDLLYAYWKQENQLKEYFLLHLFFTMVTEKYASDLEDMIEVTDGDAHILQYQFYKKFNLNNYRRITQITPIHKLTYKVDEADMRPDSYYKYLVEEESSE